MSTDATLAGAQTPRTLLVWLVIAVCAMLAGTAHAAVSGRSRSSAQCRTVASRLRDAVSPADAAIFNPADTWFMGDCAMPRHHVLVSLHRMRARHFFQRDCPNGSGIAGKEHIQLSVLGVIVAPRDAVEPIIFLSAETTRGPPLGGAHSPLLFNGTRDRPAPQSCAGPLPSDLPLPDSSSARNGSCSPIHSSLASRVSVALVAADLSLNRYPTIHAKELS